MDLDILEPLAEFLIEFAPQIVIHMFGKCEPIPPALAASKKRVQTLFGPDGWWNESSDWSA
jgi:hypothetical protein